MTEPESLDSGIGTNNREEEQEQVKLSGWGLLRNHLQSSSRYATALENFKGNFQTEEGGDRKSNMRAILLSKMGESGDVIAAQLKGMNDGLLGMTSTDSSDSICSCDNTCSENKEESNGCQCNCSKCYHKRPENCPKQKPKPAHFTIIRHASLFNC